MEVIQAGLFSKVVDAVKKLSESFSKLLSQLDDYGIEITKQETLQDGSQKMWCKYGNKPFGMIVSKPENSDKVNIKIHVDGKDTELKNINEFDVEKQVKQAISNLLNIDFSNKGSVNSSKKLNITLHKVVAKNEVDIRLTAINANFDLNEASDMLDTVLDNDEFLDSLSDTPSSFCITEDGEDYCIDSIDEVDRLGAIDSVICGMYQLWYTCFQLYCESCLNPDFKNTETLRYDCNLLYESFCNLITLRVNMSGETKPINSYCYNPSSDYLACDTCDALGNTIGEQIYNAVDQFIRVVEFNAPNFDFESTTIISDIIRTLYHFKSAAKHY